MGGRDKTAGDNPCLNKRSKNIIKLRHTSTMSPGKKKLNSKIKIKYFKGLVQQKISSTNQLGRVDKTTYGGYIAPVTFKSNSPEKCQRISGARLKAVGMVGEGKLHGDRQDQPGGQNCTYKRGGGTED